MAIDPATGAALAGAASAAFKALGKSKGSGGPVRVSQGQETSQSTGVNVRNILGGREFGGFDSETGEFDSFKAIGDIFRIQQARQQAIENARQRQDRNRINRQKSIPQTQEDTILGLDPPVAVAAGVGLIGVIALLAGR